MAVVLLLQVVVFVAILLLTTTSHEVIHPSSAVDLSFEFVNSTEGWGQTTVAESQAEVYHYQDDGQLRIQISGTEPHIDSPRMSLPLRERQTIVMRYRAAQGTGIDTKGRFRLRIASGGISRRNPTSSIVDYAQSSWDNSGGGGGGGGDAYDDETAGTTLLFLDVPFDVRADTNWHTVYAEISLPNDEYDYSPGYHLTQLRLWPILSACNGASFHIDFVRLARAPIILKVTGCMGEVYSDSAAFPAEEYMIEEETTKINEALYEHKTTWRDRGTDLKYGRTYNCVRKGGERIKIEGANLGEGGRHGFGARSQVFIDGEPCLNVTHDPDQEQQALSCISPALSRELDSYSSLIASPSLVQLRNGILPGLIDEKAYFSYAKGPPSPINVKVFNVASRSVDVSWAPGGSVLNHMVVTGYLVRWRGEDTRDEERASATSGWRKMILGNVTMSTVRGLKPSSRYHVVISALAEDQHNWAVLDHYGRKAQALDGALEGLSSTIQVQTLSFDLQFRWFDANATLNHGPIDKRSNVGPTGVEMGEGHYGINLVGNAGIENCSSSSFCCDFYDPLILGSYKSDSLTCRSTAYYDFRQSRCVIESFSESNTINDVSSACGPALRLTKPGRKLNGAAWYRRRQEVAEGFTSTFTFRIANPSSQCHIMNGVHNRCRSRGADGIAFVVQAEGPYALGKGGSGMGYSGINNSLAVEFDSYSSYQNLDPYENHISVHTRGFHPNDSNHTYSLGHTNAVPDMSDGSLIRIKIEYLPRFDVTFLHKSSFVASSYVTQYFHNTNYPQGGLGDWGDSGLGMLHIYCMDLEEPVLTVPLNLAATLSLDGGRAFVGFTAGTGEDTWQSHDILDWTFSSLRMDSDYYEPVVLNGD